MAPRGKGSAPKSWNNTAPLEWGSVSGPDPEDEQSNILLEPGRFGEVAPVTRPDVPEIEEKLPTQARDNSLLSGFLDVMDNVVPDDLGGMVRGTSGWLSKAPIYGQTVGKVVDIPLSGAESVINAINWGSEQMNHLGAALFSALPGGIQTLDWEQSQDISLGQVVTANAAINNRAGIGGWLINAATAQAPIAALAAIGASQDPDNVLYSDKFDILDDEQRKEAFESGGMGQITSGFADAIWLVAADPTIIGGKFTNIIRLGTKAGKFGGMSNQALRTTEQVERFGSTLDEQGELIETLGVEGARASGRLTAEGENLIAAMEGNADQLVNHPWVRSSSNKRDLRALLAETSVEDPRSAAYLSGALAGRAESWRLLREYDPEMYFAATERIGVDVFAPVGDRVFQSTPLARLTDDQIALGDTIVRERAAQRQDLFDNIDFDKIDPTNLAAGQLIERGGSRLSPRAVRAANAWRAGAASGQFENNAFKGSITAAATNRGHWTYNTIAGVAGSRPLKVVRWLGQGTPTGVISTKNGADASESLRNVTSWLRKSPIGSEESAVYLNRFAAAVTPVEKSAILDEMQREAARLISAQHGVSAAAAEKAYDSYVASRALRLSSIKKTETKFAIEEDGKIVKVPEFYAEIDPNFIMLDTKVFNRVIGGNKTFLRTVEDVERVGDELNKYWKLSVLLRLGYTQRNIAEGALRSFAVLGLIAANPVAFSRVPGNAIQYAGALRATRKARRHEQALLTSYENLQAARNTLDETLKVAKYDKMLAKQDEAEVLYQRIQQLRGRPQAGASIPAAPISSKVEKEIARLEARRERLLAEATGIRVNFYEPMLPEIDAARRGIRNLQLEIDDIGSQVNELLGVARSKTAQRKRGGYSENVVDGAKLQGAFQGSEGAMAAKLSSADRTTYMALDSAAGARINALEALNGFDEIDPRKLTGDQIQRYFDELTIRYNHRYRSDAVGRMAIADQPPAVAMSWVMSDAGKFYRESIEQAIGRPLDTEEAVRWWINKVYTRLDYEIPRNTPLRGILLERDIDPLEVAANFRGRELPKIPGRLDDDVPMSAFAKGKRGVDMLTDKLMRGIGSFPETKLLRHPYYNQVYMDRQKQLWRLAADQGADMGSPIVKNRINRAAHQTAMKSTRETMYTIEELSNAAVLLRYVSPFFPAFENSLRTWGRIAWTNPAVLGYGNLLWNIPNSLGWVVDEDGNKVDQSNFFVDENHFIVWPQPVADLISKMGGPFTPGESLRSRQHGLNLLFQGGQWWFPGAGPATSIPLAVALRGKPEDAEILRNFVGEEIFNQLVPSGNPNADLMDALLPTFGRRLKQMWAGESSDQAFLTTWNQIIEDQYITAQLENRTFTEKDAKLVRDKLDKFWGFQLAAALVAPFQFTMGSKYQVQRDEWNRLIDNQSLSYRDKIKAFNEKFPEFGDSLLAVTRSGSYTETKLQPNLKTWERIYSNKDLVNKLYAIDPELVGMFGNMGTFDDPFSRAVYGEFGSMKIGPNDARVRRQMKPDEIIRNNQIKDGWAEYWRVKDYVEDKAEQLGYSSLQVQEAAPLRDILDEAGIKLAERYPAWGEERKLYEDKLPAFIQGARIIVQNAELLDEDSTIRALNDYLLVREKISGLLADEKDRDTREQLKLIGYEAAWKLRQRDVGFADLYDQYLDRDDFRKI